MNGHHNDGDSKVKPAVFSPNDLPDGALSSEGAGLGMLDMSRCALFVYVDLDGNAQAHAGSIGKPQAAEWLRIIADQFEAES